MYQIIIWSKLSNMVKEYSAEQLQVNYDKFITFINKVFSGDRLEKLLHMYSETELGTELSTNSSNLQ